MKSLLNILSEQNPDSTIMRGAMSAMTVEDANAALQEFFGDKAGRYFEAIYVKNGVLGVRCHNSSAVAELKFNEALILAKISEKKHDASLKKIKIIQ
jgi:Dna[CI] antecedent, DciA